MSFQDKYIKYKTKYNNLKMLNSYKLSGGTVPMDISKIYYSDFNTKETLASKYAPIINKYNKESSRLRNKVFDTGLAVGNNYINMKLIPINDTNQNFVIINENDDTFGFLHVIYEPPKSTYVIKQPDLSQPKMYSRLDDDTNPNDLTNSYDI